MANTIEVNSSYGTYYYIDSSSSSDRLTQTQMESNVTVIYNITSDLYPTWTIEAISALCGNSESEGILNPNQWEYGYGKDPQHGYGLWQWTPSTKFINWCIENSYPTNDILHQVMRLEFERSTGIQYYQTNAYPFSFTNFLEGNHSVDQLARAWLYNYERPGDPASSEAIRVQRSEKWYEFLTGTTPEPPHPQPDPTTIRKGMPFYMYPSWRRKI